MKEKTLLGILGLVAWIGGTYFLVTFFADIKTKGRLEGIQEVQFVRNQEGNITKNSEKTIIKYVGGDGEVKTIEK